MLRVFDKPAGVTTHTSLSEEEKKRKHVDPVDGFLEHLTHRSGQALWPVHRLDVETTGVLLATDNAEEAATLGKLFESREVEKTYYFVTDRKPRKTFKSGDRIESHITRMKGGGRGQQGPQYVSFAPTSIEPMNAVTVIEFVREHGNFALYRAKPETGKPHQIRLHAESCGLPILGDTEHGGTPYPALCLHASELKIAVDGKETFAESPRPKWFENLALLEDPILVTWLAALDRRTRLMRSLESLSVPMSDTTRWVHSDGGDLRVDRIGHMIHLHWYGKQFTIGDRRRVEEFAKHLGWPDWYLQVRTNRGANAGQQASEEMIPSSTDLTTRWQASEESLRFTFRRDTGLSAGLFLDQRANRRWVLANTAGKTVLNLFCYTGGFSVAAAKGGAKQVVSVDLSKGFLEWAKENFAANSIAVTADEAQPSPYEFRSIEARRYLDWARKKGLKFDLVICDPPSFARTDDGVFRIETEFESLLMDCLHVTAPGGRVLFALNNEGMKEADVFSRAEKAVRGPIPGRSHKVTIHRTPSPDWDFEFPREIRAMKSLFAISE